MATFLFRPLVAWPGAQTPSHQRRRSLFDSTWGQTLDLLKRELDHLRAKDIVISLDVDEKDITRDNTPRSTARPRSPGVVLSFSRPGQYDPIARATGDALPLSFPCDTFDQWEDNVRAIALSLEALRKVDRYGVTKRNEQYAGFRQLPASTAPTMTTQQAAEFVSGLSRFSAEKVLRDKTAARDAVRQAVNNTHPDKPGGSHESFAKVGNARTVLSTHHGVSL
jgi:hypothetical protein